MRVRVCSNERLLQQVLFPLHFSFADIYSFLFNSCSPDRFPCFKKYVFHWQQQNQVTPLWVDIGGLVKPLVQELYLHCTAHYICLGVVPVEMIHNERRNHSRFIISGTTLNQILRDNNYSKMFQRPLLYHSLVMQRASRVLHKK